MFRTKRVPVTKHFYANEKPKYTSTEIKFVKKKKGRRLHAKSMEEDIYMIALKVGWTTVILSSECNFFSFILLL